jgi:polygalacturonase
MFGNHDDNIAIKAGRDKEGRDGALVTGTELENIESEYITNNRITGPTENVVIRNNHFYGHYAICIGSEMSGGVRNVYAVDNYSVKEVNMGFFIKSSRLRGGTVENIYVNGLKLNHVKNEVLSIVPNYDKADESPYPPTIRNVQIENVRSQSSGRGILIHGWYDEPVRNVFLKDINLSGVNQNPMQIEQSKNIVLKDVSVNDSIYHETIDHMDKGEAPPEKI